MFVSSLYKYNRQLLHFSVKMDLQKLVDINQSIKIVPSIEDSLRAIGLNVNLDEETLIWFNHLKTTWKTWRKSATVEQNIESFLQTRPDPHRIALAIVIKCSEFKDCKPKSLPFCIMETIHKLSLKYLIFPEESLKLPAFHIATKQRNQHFFNLVVKAYKLSSVKDVIIPIVRAIIDDGNYKQASQIVIAMELFEEIKVEDLLFPLIIQDKTNMIDDYLAECPNQIMPFLLYLDNLLDKSFSLREYVQGYIETHKIAEVKYEKLHHKPLGKLVARLCNKYKIPIETCKNLSKNRTSGGLRYLIHQKYSVNNVSLSVWDDLVKDSLKQNAGAAAEFIDLLSEYDRKEALKWAKYLNIPESEYPPNMQEIPTQSTNEEVENWDITSTDTQEFYKLSLPEDQIFLIDTAENFYDMTSDLIKCKVVSIDCEWKPSFGATQSQVALIQIATSDKVYLIDTMILNSKEFSSFWYTFNKSLLDNAEIIKLGFGLEQDLKEIKASISSLNNIKVKGEGLLDILLLWKSLETGGLVLPSNSDGTGSGLSSLVHACFGLPLGKAEQCSNWELRPLRTTQVQYAALDAHVLLEIYYYLQKLCLEQGIHFEEICNDIMLEGKRKSAKKSKVADRIQSSFTVSVSEIKFLVDPKLSNLLSYLRYCGIDAIVMSSSMLWHDIVNMAISDDRLILLPKIKYSPTTNYPQANILEVGNFSTREQLQKILSSFHIGLKEEKILSRCIYCNEVKLTKLTSNEVDNIFNELHKDSPNNNKHHHEFYEDNEPNYDAFLSDSEGEEDLYQQIESCTTNIVKTKSGVPMIFDDVERLIELRQPALLCEACGRFLWGEEKLVKSVSDLVSNLNNLSLR